MQRGFLSEIGNIHGISRSSVCRIISSVAISLVTTLLHKRNLPVDQHSLREIKHDCYTMSGIPNVVGAIECTLLLIIRPSEDKQIFVCRKKNSQLECAS